MKKLFTKKTFSTYRIGLLILTFCASFALQGCLHAPKQAWTPTKRKNMRDSKPRPAKYEDRLKRVRAW